MFDRPSWGVVYARGLGGDVAGKRRAVGAPPPVVGHNLCDRGWWATWQVCYGRWSTHRPLWGIIYTNGGRSVRC